MDPNNDGKKRYFDIAPPRSVPASGGPVVQHPDNHQMINVSDDNDDQNQTTNYPPAQDDTFGEASVTPEDSQAESSDRSEDSSDNVSDTNFEQTPEVAIEPDSDVDVAGSTEVTEPNVPDEPEAPADDLPMIVPESADEVAPQADVTEDIGEPAAETEEPANADTTPSDIPPREFGDVDDSIPQPHDQETVTETPEPATEMPEDFQPAEPAAKLPEVEHSAEIASPGIIDEPATAESEQPAMSETISPIEPAIDKDVPVTPAENFAVTDSLPDPGNKAADEAKEGMQDPKVFDTKEYYVPIGDTNHKHGNLKAALIFGIIIGLIVVGVIVYLMVRVGKQ